MSVPESERGHGKFEVLVKANELATYTIRITKNKNIFLPEYQTALTNDIIDASKDIFINAWTANNIRVLTADDWKKRRLLQEDAILYCYKLLALIQMAKQLYHLKSKRVKYWGEKVINVRILITNWKNTDNKRYSKL